MFYIVAHVLSKPPFALHFKKNFIKSVLMKLSYLKIGGAGRQKFALQLSFGDPLCVLCSRACSNVKTHFYLSFLGKTS